MRQITLIVTFAFVSLFTFLIASLATTDTLKDDLSHDLLYRPKEGFNAPTSSWMLDSVGIQVKDELLGSPTPFLKEIIDIVFPVLKKIEH